MVDPNTTCAAHEPMRREILASIHHLGEVITVQIESLKEDVSRRMDESQQDRKDLHESHNALAREVTTAMVRLNGAQLMKAPHPHRRDTDPDTVPSVHVRAEDTVKGWVQKNWLMLTAIVLSAFAGEKVIPAILAFFSHLLGLG